MPGKADRRIATRERVQELLAQGLRRAEIARLLDLTKSTVSHHARRLGADVDHRCARRYDWSIVQAYYDPGHSVNECVERFGVQQADNRLENLQLLCPNCHSQTENFAGRNRRAA